VGSEVFRRAAFGAHHPLKIVRHAAVLDIVNALGWLPAKSFREALPASVDTLAEFHDPDYIKALQYADSAGRVEPEIRQRYNFGTLSNPLFAGVFERAATAVGGSILAAELALRGHLVFHPSGGTHHGRRDRASGFCYFNDPVFAVLTLLKGGKQRVTYVDLDAHHGDGVEMAFKEDPRVRTISIHEDNRWPHTGAAGEGVEHGAFNLPVPWGCNDSELDFLVENAVLPLVEGFAADALVLCCGADSLAGDPLSKMMFSNVALWDTVDRLARLGLPTVILGGGGYNPWTVARYWSGMWGRISGQQLPDTLPDTAQRVLREMECDLIDEEDVLDEWLTTMADSRNTGDVRESVISLPEVVLPDKRSAYGVA
jgi:acetoin utilization protein AcuC